MDKPSFITLRAYGLLVREGQVLATRELIRGNEYMKFPGGGVEVGEGIRETLVREFKEELDLEVEAVDHIYTTDHFIQSAFEPRAQVVAVYFSVKCADPGAMRILDQDILSLHWLDLRAGVADKLSLALDRIAFEKLLIG